MKTRRRVFLAILAVGVCAFCIALFREGLSVYSEFMVFDLSNARLTHHRVILGNENVNLEWTPSVELETGRQQRIRYGRGGILYHMITPGKHARAINLIMRVDNTLKYFKHDEATRRKVLTKAIGMIAETDIAGLEHLLDSLLKAEGYNEEIEVGK